MSDHDHTPCRWMLFTLCAASLLYIGVGTPAFAQSSCSSCYQSARPQCDISCEGSPTRLSFSDCARRCVGNKCASFCGGAGSSVEKAEPQSSGNPARNGYSGSGIVPLERAVGGGSRGSGYGSNEPRDTSPCGECLEEMRVGECQQDCLRQDPSDLQQCAVRCAKARCANQCSLPGRISDEPPPATRRDCARCKHSSSTACHQRCGFDSDKPGFTTCMVSCAEQRCMDICSPSSYE